MQRVNAEISALPSLSQAVWKALPEGQWNFFQASFFVYTKLSVACLRNTWSSESCCGSGGSPGTEQSHRFKVKESRAARDTYKARGGWGLATWLGRLLLLEWVAHIQFTTTAFLQKHRLSLTKCCYIKFTNAYSFVGKRLPRLPKFMQFDQMSVIHYPSKC